jgi:rubrerythrin
MGLKEEGKKKEEQWFRENEQKLIEDIRLKRLERIKKETEREEEARREELKQLHWMSCPKCGHSMATKDIGGIEVDICSLCEGIYFDRGELEQLLMKQSHSKSGFFRKLLGLGDE